MVDTEAPALDTFKQSCEKFDVEPPVHVYIASLGLDYTQGMAHFKRELADLVPIDQFFPYWEELYNRMINSPTLALMPGAGELLHALSNSDVSLIVATSSSRDGAAKKMRTTQIDHYFDHVVTGDDVERGKPDPAIYLQAMSKVSANPSMCLALEDSDNGVSSAKAAGMQVCHVPNLAPAGTDSQHPNVHVFDSLFDVMHHFGFTSTRP